MSEGKRLGTVSRLKGWRLAPLALFVVLLCGVITSAATYLKTTLKDLTRRSVAVVEVDVIDRKYPPMTDGQTFPRTLTELKARKTLKGNMPETFTIDTPGGLDGNIASYVADGAEFRNGERAMVFIKEVNPGHYMVQDLGLGKFNIVQRNGQTFVESPLCPLAQAPSGKLTQKDDLEASLLTKSIPYDQFCNLVTAYASGSAAPIDAAALAATLQPSSSHKHDQAPAVLADARKINADLAARRGWYALGAAIAFIAIVAALVVRYRRRVNAGPASGKAVALMMGGALAIGAAMGGTTSRAFVPFENKTVWDLDTVKAGKVENQKIIFKESSSVSVTNANCFDGTRKAYGTWEAVTASRLAFTNGGGTTANINNSRDTENIVAWNTNPSNDFSENTLAICFSSFTTGTSSKFVDGDIIFNDREFDWSKQDVESVALHEIGHFVGLKHTTQQGTVMFPFDSGLTALTPDEIAAARALYAGPDDSTPAPTPAIPPVAVAEGSPTTGVPPLDVSFTGLDSDVGDPAATIVSYVWDFGDGATGTGAEVSHTYTSTGNFTATLTVTDSNGQKSIATVAVSVGAPATASKAQFKLNFKTFGKDSFTATVSNPALRNFLPTTPLTDGFLNIGDTPWRFTYDGKRKKNIDLDGLKVTVNTKKGEVTVKAANSDLQDVLGGHGAEDETVFKTVNVPFTIWFGEGANIFISGTIPFNYKATEGKSGAGKF